MLIISKPTIFAPDGFAVRGQCSPDSPGWQLRWFEQGVPLTVVWQGAFKTCRHLQSGCAEANTAEEAKEMVDLLLKSNDFTRFNSMPTDIYPAAKNDDPAPGTNASPSPGPANQKPGKSKKHRKRKRH